MAVNLDKASKNIATNLVGVRRAKGISQAQLANISGLTRASIALIESGSSNPSLQGLIRLSQCLQISIDELIASPRAECQLVKAKDVPLERRSKNGVKLRKLLPDQIPATEIDELILEPDAILTGSPHIQGTREYFTCIKGEVSIGVLGEIYHLEKGDVLSFPGDKPHSYKNIGKSVAQGISVVLFRSLALLIALILPLSASFANPCVRPMWPEDTFTTIRERTATLDKTARKDVELAEISEYLTNTFQSFFPKGPIQIRGQEKNEISIKIHSALMTKYKQLQRKHWPYRQTLYFFKSAVEYTQVKSFDVSALKQILELVQAPTVPAARFDPELESAIRQSPALFIVPSSDLSPIEEMNEWGGRGAHFFVSTNKRQMVDGSRIDQVDALGHDFGHFDNMTKSNLEFWQSVVAFFNSQEDPIIRKALHVMFFDYWHERNNSVSHRSLLNWAKYSQYDDAIEGAHMGIYGPEAKNITSDEYADAGGIFLAWLRKGNR